MGELVTTSGGALAHLDLSNVESIFGDLASDVGDGLYGKFNGNTGDFTYGQDDELLEHGDQVQIDYTSCFQGFLCWIGGKVEDRVVVKVLEGRPPLEKDLPDHGPYDQDDGWGPSCGFKIVTETGDEVTMNLNSRSGDIAFRRLLGQIGKGAAKNPGKLPVVELGAAAFENKKSRGRKFAPTFEIVGWETPEEFAGTGHGDDPDDYDEPETDAEEQEEEEAAIPTKDTARTARASKATAKDDTPPPASRRSRKDTSEDEDEGPKDERPARRRRRNV
jgi:hypothetical protein